MLLLKKVTSNSDIESLHIPFAEQNIYLLAQDASGRQIFGHQTIRGTKNWPNSFFITPSEFNATLEEATNATAKAETDLVIWGQLTAFETTDSDTAVINGQYHLIDAQTMQPIFTGTISTTKQEAATETVPEAQAVAVVEQATEPTVPAYEATIPLYARILAFVFIAILLPMITFPFFRSTAARRSNQANAIVIVLYAAIGGILAFLMIGGSFATPALTALFFIAFIANAIYDLAMLSFATRLEE